MRSTEFAPKKEGNCNFVATWPRHLILLVIPPNNIPQSPLIALTYRFDGSPFWYTKPHLFIVENWLSYIVLLGSAPFVILLQFWFLLITISFIETRLFFIQIYCNSDHPTKSCNWWRPTKQNQPRMALALGRRDFSSKRRYQALGNLRDKAQDA